MSLEKLSPTLGVEDYFTPENEAALSNKDLDFGCSDVILLPAQTGRRPEPGPVAWASGARST